ncbi:transporter substrate-binding domain-containing protein [Bradyrhizobium sp. PMVTL-01]|uniref:transporter substrate-binding domain-containing protein n=1 Tax=Bradyrhizobium sp. PMVTL-01 TaxID=3434999 RepID=UPI003F72E5E9
MTQKGAYMPRKIDVCLVMIGLALAASLATGTVYAQDAQKVINAGTITYYPPFAFKDPKTNELMGFNHDLFEAMAKKLGAKVNWIEFKYADLASFAPLSFVNEVDKTHADFAPFGRIGQRIAGIRKKDLGETLKKALDELIADGTYVKLLQKWMIVPLGPTSSINAGPQL